MAGAVQDHYRMFALYNRWANDRLYAASALLPAEQLAEDRGGFFRSVLGTLNHLLVADRIWMGRLEGNSPLGYRLDEMPYPELASLKAARQAENARIIGYVYDLDETAFAKPLEYRTNAGAQVQPVGQILAHLFNHQTHHRGQAHDLLGQIAGTDKAPSLDLIAYQRFVLPGDAP